MHESFNTSEENQILLQELKDGKGVVGVRFARSARPGGSTFFASLEKAEPLIRETLADMSINGFWVGCHELLQPDLYNLLMEINETRAFSGMSSSTKGWISYDLL